MFDEVFDRTLALEGDFVDDPSDSGGATRYGITERVARAHGYGGAMESLPIAVARGIARRQYWDVLHLEEIAAVAGELAAELFDTGYNMGPAAAGRFLQRALNALNRGGTDYPDLEVDGVIGPMTLDALLAYVSLRDETGVEVLLLALNCLQGARYVELCEAREKDERFIYGWLRHRIQLVPR